MTSSWAAAPGTSRTASPDAGRVADPGRPALAQATARASPPHPATVEPSTRLRFHAVPAEPVSAAPRAPPAGVIDHGRTSGSPWRDLVIGVTVWLATSAAAVGGFSLAARTLIVGAPAGLLASAVVFAVGPIHLIRDAWIAKRRARARWSELD